MAIDVNAETKKKINVSRLVLMIKIMAPVSNYAPEKVPPKNKLVEKEMVIEIIERIVAEAKDE